MELLQYLRGFLIHNLTQEKLQNVFETAQWRLLLKLQLQQW